MKQLSLIFVIIFCYTTVIFAGEVNNDDVKKERFAIEQASQKIANNKEVLDLLLRQAQDKTIWYTAVADKITDQPVAIIKLIVFTNITVSQVCPRPRIDSIGYEMSNYYWGEFIQRDIQELMSFTLNNPEEEKNRQQCLQANQKALAALQAKK